MTKIRIETRQPPPFARTGTRPWLRYLVLATALAMLAWLASIEGIWTEAQTALRSVLRLVGL